MADEEATSNKGYVHIYTGRGKGKTTAAAGQLVRAAGHGMEGRFITFFKGDEFDRGLVNALDDLQIPVINFVSQHPGFDQDHEQDVLRETKEGAKFINNIYNSKHQLDILVLDEIITGVRDDLIQEDDLLGLIRDKPYSLELILTGRGASSTLIEFADLVSRIVNEKHYWEKGVEARKGIEY